MVVNGPKHFLRWTQKANNLYACVRRIDLLYYGTNPAFYQDIPAYWLSEKLHDNFAAAKGQAMLRKAAGKSLYYEMGPKLKSVRNWHSWHKTHM